MKPNKYWLKRQAETASALTTKSINETNVQRAKYYRDAMRRIISDFEKTYDKVITAFGQDKQVTPADLYKLDRYWKMQAEMREELKKLGDKEAALLSEKFERHWKDIYESAAVPSEDNFVKYSSRNAAEMINEIWCADGKNWSQRVWHNVGKLQEELNSSLLDCVISGKTTKELKQQLQKDFGVSYNRAKSIVNTEMAHIQTQSAAQRYKDSGVEYYEFLADTDKSTCDICAALDGKRFKLIEMQPGENAPPMHPNDRCCIIPVIEKKEEDLTLPKNSDNIKPLEKRQTPLPLNIQLFAKKSSDYKTVILPKKEYAHVMSEIATWITEEKLMQPIIKKNIGNYTYTIENNGFGNFRIIGRRKIK